MSKATGAHASSFSKPSTTIGAHTKKTKKNSASAKADAEAALAVQQNWERHRERRRSSDELNDAEVALVRKKRQVNGRPGQGSEVPKAHVVNKVNLSSIKHRDSSRHRRAHELTQHDAATAIQVQWRYHQSRRYGSNIAGAEKVVRHTEHEVKEQSAGYTRVLPKIEPPPRKKKRRAPGGRFWGCYLCCDGSPLEPELQSIERGGAAAAPEIAHRWNVDLLTVPSKHPGSCLLATAFGPCYACYLRHALLDEHLERYMCCQGIVSEKFDFCLCNSSPICCMVTESHICCPCAVGGNREYVQKRVGGNRVLNDPCDNRIMRCNNCVDTMLCKCNWWLCCPLTEEHGEQQWMAINRENRKLNVFGLMAYLPVLSCLQVQTLLQFTRGSKEPPVNKLAELPRWWGDRLAGEIHPDDDGGLKLWLSAHDPRSKDLHIDGRKKRGYKRTIKGQPRRSNRVHPLHPLHPLTPHIKELRTKDVPDPTREPDADTEEVHALWATSHVNRSAWKRSGWVDNSETRATSPITRQTPQLHESRELATRDLRDNGPEPPWNAESYRSPRGATSWPQGGRFDSDGSNSATEEYEIAALLENATMVGSDLMTGKTAPRQKGTLASLQHHETDGRIPGRSNLRSDGKRKKKAHKHKNAAHHSDGLIKRGETPAIARSPSGNGFVALDGDSDNSASSDRSTAATESSTPWKTREKAAEPKKNNRARRLSENEAALVIQGRFRQHQDRKRNDRPPPVYRGDRSMAMRDLADSGSATPRTPKSTVYTRDVHMTHDDAIGFLKRSHFEAHMSPIRNLKVRTNRNHDDKNKPHREKAMDEYFS